MVTSIEQHINWIAACIAHVKQSGSSAIEATRNAEEKWVSHVNERRTDDDAECNSWYVGACASGLGSSCHIGGAAVYKKVIEESPRIITRLWLA
jgi:cyclohexanone monooxygenase